MSDCTDFGDCFETEYGAFGVRLRPAIDPSPENGLVCRPAPGSPGLWDPDERVAVACRTIAGTLYANGLNSSTNFTVPIFVGLTITNPSLLHPAQVYWAWDVSQIEIHASPNVRGQVVVLTSIFPNLLVDVGYVVFQNYWEPAAADFITTPGPAEAFGDCPAIPPTILPPGGSATRVWGYRFEGAGSPFGSWRAVVGPLQASAMAVTVPT
jgi:hypothetical protein